MIIFRGVEVYIVIYSVANHRTLIGMMDTHSHQRSVIESTEIAVMLLHELV